MVMGAAIAVGVALLVTLGTLARALSERGWLWMGVLGVCVTGWCWGAWRFETGDLELQGDALWLAFVELASGGFLLFGRRARGPVRQLQPWAVSALLAAPFLVVLSAVLAPGWWARHFHEPGDFDTGGWAFLLHSAYCVALLIAACALLIRRAEYSRGRLRWALIVAVAACVAGMATQIVGLRLMQYAALGCLLAILVAYAELARDPYAMVDPVDLDPLTGVLNRGGLHRVLDRSLERAERYGQPLALMLIDIDHFKRFNDLHGHLAGDAVLLATATRLSALVGRDGSVARFGGDEFIVIVAGLDVAHSVSFAMRTVDVASQPVESPEGELRPTVSVGVATYHGGTPTDLIARADEAMYDAKSRGGDTLAVRA